MVQPGGAGRRVPLLVGCGCWLVFFAVLDHSGGLRVERGAVLGMGKSGVGCDSAITGGTRLALAGAVTGVAVDGFGFGCALAAQDVDRIGCVGS